MAFEERGFELAYRAYAARLRAVAYHVLGDRDAAEDVVHGALMREWSTGAYRPERGALLPFLIACVRRAAYDVIRSSRRRRDRELRAVPDQVIPDPTAAIDPVETQRVRAALDTLPPAQRQVVMRAYYGNRTLSEVAAELDIPLGTVKSRLANALRLLAVALSGGPGH